jgi:hypothetical protein
LSGGEDAPTAAVRSPRSEAFTPRQARQVRQVRHVNEPAAPFEEAQEDALTLAARPSYHRTLPPAPAFAALDAPPIVTTDSDELVFHCATTPLDDSRPAANVRASRASFADGVLSPFGPTADMPKSSEGATKKSPAVKAAPPELPPKKEPARQAEKKRSGPRLDLTMRSRKPEIARAVEQARVLVTEPVGHPVSPAPVGAPNAPLKYPTAPTPATSVAAARAPRHSRADDTGPRAPMRRPTPSEPWSESPWVLSSSPSQPQFQPDLLPTPYGAASAPRRIELSMVAAIATGAVAFCLILGAFFFTRQAHALPLEETANATSAADAIEGAPAVPVPAEGTVPPASSGAPVPPPPATGTAATAPATTSAPAPASDARVASEPSEPSPPKPTRKPRPVKVDDSSKTADSADKPVKSSSTSTASASSSASASKKKNPGNAPKSLEQILDELGEEQLRR